VIARPVNCLMASASVVIGGFLASRAVSPRTVLAAGMAFLVCAGAYVLNDLLDVAADRLVKPRRPLAAGLVTPGFAVRYGVGLWAGGLVLAGLAGVDGLGFFAAWTLALWLYSSRLKGRGIWGHLAVSLVASSGFLLGAASEGELAAGLVPAAVAAVFHITREIAKAVADEAGDRAAGVRTLAVRMGGKAALDVVAWCLGVCIVVSLAPAASRDFGWPYLVVVLAGVLPFLAIALSRIAGARRAGGDPAATARVVALTLKAAMVAGLAAFFASGFLTGEI